MDLYPHIAIEKIQHPNRWYAIPFFGFLFKLISIIPVGLEISILRFAVFLLSMLNSFGIFARGRYWKLAYSLNLGTMQLEANLTYFLYGLTDRYPGFALTTTDYSFTLPMIKNPNRFFATPILGVIIRFILMIPYLIYRHVVSFAANLAMLVSWIPVLFMGKYPETTYEMIRDSVRVDQATSAYFLGMSDKYPSFWISMNHKALKILLLALAIIFSLWTFWGNSTSWYTPHPSHHTSMMSSLY